MRTLVVILLLCENFFASRGTAPSEELDSEAAPDINPVFCVKPPFWDRLCVNGTPPDTHIASTTHIQVSKLPFKDDVWLHLDIFTSPSKADMKQVAIAVGARGEAVGQFAGNLPCIASHKRGFAFIPELDQLMDTSDPLALEVYECLSEGTTPTVTQPIITFMEPVPAFYVHYKLTSEEMRSMEDTGFQLQVIVVDERDRCHTHLLSKRLLLRVRDPAVYSYNLTMGRAINCHLAKGVVPLGGGGGPDMTLNPGDAQYKQNVRFSTTHAKKSQSSPALEDVAVIKFMNDWNTAKLQRLHYQSQPPLPLLLADGRRKPSQSKEVKDPEISSHPKLDMYVECLHTLGCMGDPPNCVGGKSCRSIISYKKDGDFVRFEMWGLSPKYLALAISYDKFMGNDSVVECVREENDIVRVYTSWNLDSPNRHNIRLTNNANNIEDAHSKFSDGVIYCSFRMKKSTTVEGFEFNLEKEKFYLFSATGSQAENGADGRIEHHDSKIVSSQKLLLYVQVGKSANELLLGKIHGVGMIVVWVFIVPLGAFVARYFKETFVTIYVCNLSLWFMIHLVCMICTIGGTIGSVVAICVVTSRWPGAGRWTLHDVLGLVMMILVVIQVPLAMGILKFNRRHRHLFINFLHGFGGHLLFILGFACILVSRDLREGLPCESKFVLVSWIVVYFIIHIIMSYQVCYSDFKLGKGTGRSYTLGPLDIPKRSLDGKDEPGALSRKFGLGLFVICSLAFTLTLVWQFLWGGMVDCVEARLVAN